MEKYYDDREAGTSMAPETLVRGSGGKVKAIEYRFHDNGDFAGCVTTLPRPPTVFQAFGIGEILQYVTAEVGCSRESSPQKVYALNNDRSVVLCRLHCYRVVRLAFFARVDKNVLPIYQCPKNPSVWKNFYGDPGVVIQYGKRCW